MLVHELPVTVAALVTEDPKAAKPVLEADSCQAWTDFLRLYAQGQFSPSDIPALPPLPDGAENNGKGSSNDAKGAQGAPDIGTTFDSPVYSSVEITPEVAARVRDFYRAHRFLPPPRAPLEHLREQCIVEYDLYSEQQIKNIRSATELVQSFFGGLCTFSLFRDNVQELMAVAGAPEVIEAVQLFPGKRLLPETSLCGHSVLLGDKNLYIPNLALDWRYCGNPYADELKGVKSYFGSVVSLNVDPSSSSDDRSVGIGVINIMHLDRYLPPLSEEQLKVVHTITAMLETQLRATWDGQGRTREARLRRAISDFIEDTLVQPGLPAGASDDKPPEDRTRKKTDVLASYAQLAVDRIRGVIEEMDGAMIVDLRALHPIVRLKARAEADGSAHRMGLHHIPGTKTRGHCQRSDGAARRRTHANQTSATRRACKLFSPSCGSTTSTGVPSLTRISTRLTFDRSFPPRPLVTASCRSTMVNIRSSSSSFTHLDHSIRFEPANPTSCNQWAPFFALRSFKPASLRRTQRKRRFCRRSVTSCARQCTASSPACSSSARAS